MNPETVTAEPVAESAPARPAVTSFLSGLGPNQIAALAAFAERMMASLCLDTGEQVLALDETRAMRTARTVDAPAAPQHIAVIPLQGSLRPSALSGFADRVNQAAANNDIGAIVLNIDSPGGTYAGTPEAAAAVANAVASGKQVLAYVDTLAASAAYWIASQASAVWSNQSAEIGSIGVISMHFEASKAMEAAGITPTITRSVPNKATANPFEPLSEDTRAKISSDVADAHGEFVRAVAKGRGVPAAKVDSDFGKGFTMGAIAAQRAGMIDQIGTMAQAIQSLRTKSGAIRRRSAVAF